MQLRPGPMPGRSMAPQDLVAGMLGMEASDGCPAMQTNAGIWPAHLGQLRQHRRRGIWLVLIVQLDQQRL